MSGKSLVWSTGPHHTARFVKLAYLESEYKMTQPFFVKAMSVLKSVRNEHGTSEPLSLTTFMDASVGIDELEYAEQHIAEMNNVAEQDTKRIAELNSLVVQQQNEIVELKRKLRNSEALIDSERDTKERNQRAISSAMGHIYKVMQVLTDGQFTHTQKNGALLVLMEITKEVVGYYGARNDNIETNDIPF